MPKVLLRLLLTLACWQLTLATLPRPIVSWQSDGVSPERVRAALRALLALNDGELQSLLGGTPPRALAPRVSPSTLLFLAATHRKLQKLRNHLPRTVVRIPGDMTIAKRRRGRKLSAGVPVSTRDVNLNPDSLMDAIAELAEYVDEHREPHASYDVMENNDGVSEVNTLAARDAVPVHDGLSRERDLSSVDERNGVVKSRSRRSHNEHHRNAYHHNQRETNSNNNNNVNNIDKHNCQLHKFHPEFWFRPQACPPTSSGNPLLFCPTPDDKGEWTCIEQDDLCNDSPDCPGAEDELPQSCLFYAPVRDQLEEVFFILSQLQYY